MMPSFLACGEAVPYTRTRQGPPATVIQSVQAAAVLVHGPAHALPARRESATRIHQRKHAIEANHFIAPPVLGTLLCSKEALRNT